MLRDQNLTRRGACVLGGLAVGLCACSGGSSEQAATTATEQAEQAATTATEQAEEDAVEAEDGEMTLDEKVSQLIIPSLHSTTGEDDDEWGDIRVLEDCPELAEALQRHQYGGIALFGENMESAEQVCRLTDALQRNNGAIKGVTHVPYLMCADGEGGVVVRLTMGTRMPGAMAVGATGPNAEENARMMGQVLAEELAAVGVNVDFAPDADVNVNPGNPVIGVRSFGDDAEVVASLACAMGEGISDKGVIPCYKHFPGHGDTDTDSHAGMPVVNRDILGLMQCELVPFKAAIRKGCDLIMTAHITCPEVDEEVTFPSGEKGYYPATMSKYLLGDLLRGQLGYDGVIVADSLDMGAMSQIPLVEGEIGSVEYAANIAAAALNAGVDLLLNPMGIVSAQAVDFYDEYIDLICKKVESGEIAMSRIDEAVDRVLRLKQNHGIMDLLETDGNLEVRAAEAEETVGSVEHHEIERAMTEQAITVVKNADSIMPLVPEGSYVVLVRLANEEPGVSYAIDQLKNERLIDPDAFVNNLISGEATGPESSPTKVTIDYYYDEDADAEHYTDDLAKAISEADAVIGETTTRSGDALAESSVQRQVIDKVIDETHKAGARFIQLSDNLPYDVACFSAADAQVLAYMSSGTHVDPTEHTGNRGNAPAYNANYIAALKAIFGGFVTIGSLPVTIYGMETAEDGSVSFSDEAVFGRGFGMTYV